MSIYEDFRLDIEAAAEGRFKLRMRNARGQEQSTSLSLPLGDPTFIAFMNAIKSRMPLSEAHVKELGQLIYTTLFNDGRLWGLFLSSQNQAANDGKNLRIIIATDPEDPQAKDAAAFPWEFACDDVGIPLVKHHSIVRYLPRVEPTPPLSAPGQLVMLLASALPQELQTAAPVDIDAERQIVRTALQPLVDAGTLSIIEEPHLTPRILQRTLSRNAVHIFHFVGHGVVDSDGTAQLVLENDQGGRIDLSAQKLAAALPRSVRLVVLNACKTSTITAELLQGMAPALLGANIPAVIAMQSAILDSAGRDFADEFYYHLGDGQPIDRCVAEGRRAMLLGEHSSIDWGLVTLYMRAQDGHVFAADGQAKAASPADPSPVPAQNGGVSANINFGSGNQIEGSQFSIGNVGTVVQNSSVHHAPGQALSTPPAQPSGLTEEEIMELEDQKELRKTHQRRLYILKQQQATYGLSVDPRVVIEIEDINAKIQEVNTRITELERRR